MEHANRIYIPPSGTLFDLLVHELNSWFPAMDHWMCPRGWQDERFSKNKDLGRVVIDYIAKFESLELYYQAICRFNDTECIRPYCYFSTESGTGKGLVHLLLGIEFDNFNDPPIYTVYGANKMPTNTTNTSKVLFSGTFSMNVRSLMTDVFGVTYRVDQVRGYASHMKINTAEIGARTIVPAFRTLYAIPDGTLLNALEFIRFDLYGEAYYYIDAADYDDSVDLDTIGLQESSRRLALLCELIKRDGTLRPHSNSHDVTEILFYPNRSLTMMQDPQRDYQLREFIQILLNTYKDDHSTMMQVLRKFNPDSWRAQFLSMDEVPDILKCEDILDAM